METTTAALLKSLNAQRDHVLGILEGLSDDELTVSSLPSETTATGHSCTPSAPVSSATAPSGKRVYRCAGMPAELAAASSCDSAVPASQYTCR